MENRLQVLVARMKELEQELLLEIQKKEEEYYYRIFGKQVTFEGWIKHEQKALVMKVIPYIREAAFLNILSAPVIWSVLPFALMLDLMMTVYQAVCFPIYGIPKVKRGEHIVLDRHALAYLNILEKINCEYCAYVNGLLAYLAEIAGRSEQYWCPIKHARKIATMHYHYIKFLEFGDGAGYREHLETVRRDFSGLDGSVTGEGGAPAGPACR